MHATARNGARPGGALAAAVLLGVAALCLGSCRSGGPGGKAAEPIPPSFEPIVLSKRPAGSEPGARAVRDRRPVDDADRGWAEKYELASHYVAGGFDDKALAVLRAALALEPPSPWNVRFAELRASLKEQRIETELLRVDVRGTKDYVPFHTDVDWVIRIRNVSNQLLRFPAPGTQPGEPSPAVLFVSVVRRDVDIYGAELERTWSETVALQRAGGLDLVIPVGGVFEKRVRVPADDVGVAISGLRTLDLGGTLRARVRRGTGAAESVSLPIRPGRVVVLPSGYEPLAADPLGSLDAARTAVAPTHLLIAAEFLSRDQSDRGMEALARTLAEGAPALSTAAYGALGLLRERNVGRPIAPFVRPLVLALTDHPDRADELMEALSRVSGERLPPDERLWVDWWRRAREQGLRVPPREQKSPARAGA